MKNIVLVLLGVVLMTSCSQQKVRRPISESSGTFMKESAERNKKLVATEEGKIDSIIKSNPNIKYIASSKGYWYHYESKNEMDTLRPKKGDIAYFDYEIKDLNGNIIYSQLELRPQTYYVDKEQKIIIGLRHGIKLMHKKEKGNLFIEISHDHENLFIKIADNGIGRKQAAALTSKSPTRHKSMGLHITEERITMLQSTNGKSAVGIHDLVYADGGAAGTEVVINIPMQYD